MFGTEAAVGCRYYYCTRTCRIALLMPRIHLGPTAHMLADLREQPTLRGYPSTRPPPYRAHRPSVPHTHSTRPASVSPLSPPQISGPAYTLPCSINPYAPHPEEARRSSIRSPLLWHHRPKSGSISQKARLTGLPASPLRSHSHTSWQEPAAVAIYNIIYLDCFASGWVSRLVPPSILPMRRRDVLCCS
ncbi:hypothetical protein FKP32DRAFT_1418983 [Trametes sanguinea]|nr:hypothetical protein FKP32DRAFT_1418983 [Trametes sanguinea]